MKKILLTATVLSHIKAFHIPFIGVLKENGYEVHVAAKKNLAENIILNGVDKIYDICFERSPFSKKNIEAYKQLKKVIDKNDYDIIHCHTPVGGVITRMAAKNARKKGAKVFYTAHGFHFYKGAPFLNWLIYYPIEKLFARYTDKLITINYEDYKRAKNNFKTDVYRIHGMGVNPEIFKPVSEEEKINLKCELGFSKDDFICICTGELNDNKNQKFVISAISDIILKNKNVKLILAGKGYNLDNLKMQASNLGISDNVVFLGYTTEISKYLKISDVAISASIREGLGLNLVEAMMCGKPIIASDNRGHRELINNCENGYLIYNFNENKFREYLNELIYNEVLREKMGKEGYRYAQKYSLISSLEELKKIYGII